MTRLLLAIACLPAAAALSPAADPPPRAFLDAHCVSCHDAESKKGNLDLTALNADVGDPKAFARWVKVHDRVAAGEMPPKSVKARPDPKEADRFLTALAVDLTKADLARRGPEGRATVRRLTRTEYEY